jgi:hypothetical protein
MKEPWEWNEDDLQSLITNGVQESLELEYKACPSLAKGDKEKNELSKDVSAFANSAGGTIVYGMREKDHLPEAIDAGYDPSGMSKEWLEQVINSRIQRRIDGVRINQVRLTKTSPGKVAYVVYIPQSTRAAHQAADKKFYKRYNFESIPMEEYEIRDVSRRAETPDLRIYFELRDSLPVTGETVDGLPITLKARLVPVIANDAATPAEHAIIHIFVDDRLQIRPPFSELRSHGTIDVQASGRQYRCKSCQLNWSVPQMPVFEGVNLELLRIPFSIGIPGAGQYLLAWEIHSPRMQTKLGHHFLNADPTTAEVVQT